MCLGHKSGSGLAQDIVYGCLVNNGHENQSKPVSPSRNLAKHWGLDEMPAIVARSLSGQEITISDLRVNTPSGELSTPLPRDDAYMICLVLRDLPQNSYWEEGRELGKFSLKRGQVAISDLRRQPAGLVTQPIHTMLFNFPRMLLTALADELNVPRVDELCFQAGVGTFDATIMHLGLSLMPALENPGRVNRLFTDYVTLAFTSHVAPTYGGMQIAPKLAKGGLASWQEKLSKDLIASDLSGGIALRDIAKACGLSPGHFSRAFRKSTGLAPHAWLLHARVEAAKAMLRGRRNSLSEIAGACGFSDQSHFSRVFTRRVGLSPGAWRKIAVE
jgi:AraC-like DNA-binding protein